MKLSRETLLGVGILALLLALTIAAALLQDNQAQPELASTSSAKDGALALKLWMDELDHPVDASMPDDFHLPKNAALVFMLQPGLVTQAELTMIDAWVAAGGTLIAAGDGDGLSGLARHYGFTLQDGKGAFDRQIPQAPLFTTPPMQPPATADILPTFKTDRQDFFSLTAQAGEPVIVFFDSGNGRVILSATAYPFTNLGLKANGNPQLVLNLVAIARRDGPVWFDEWHHGLRGGVQIVGPERWLRYTPGGNALLFSVAVLFLALLLQGRAFGRPIPQKREVKRRGPLEYLSAIANLNRRAGHRSAILDHYRQQIKRRLGQRYRLDPAVSDEEFITALARYNPALDAGSLRDLFQRLSRPARREADMVKLAAEASQWLDE